jgi:hypothetical protein
VPGPPRAGSLTAPNRRGARVTATIIALPSRAVKEKTESSCEEFLLQIDPATGHDSPEAPTIHSIGFPGRGPHGANPCRFRLADRDRSLRTPDARGDYR